MASRIVVLADEASAAGFRLAGIEALGVDPAQVAPAFGAALESATLVVLTRRLAGALPAQALQRAQLGPAPLVVVMPEVADPDAISGFAPRMRRVLGIET